MKRSISGKLLWAMGLAVQLAPLPAAAEGPACSRLAGLAADTAPDERIYGTGSCAVERREYREAIRLLAPLVERDAWPVYRAELGRAYLGAQEFELARTQFLKALESNPPENAARLLQMFLRMAEQEQTQAREWFGTVSLGYVHDSNLNTGPVSPDVTLFGLPFTMDDSAMPRSDHGVHAAFSGVHVKALGDSLAWQTNAGLDLMRYQTWHQYDTTQVSVETGPQFNLARGRLGLYVPAGVSRVYLDSAAYATTRSLSPQLRYAVGDSDLATVGLSRQQTAFAGSSAMSSVSTSAFLGWRHVLANNWSVEPSLRHVSENAGDPVYSNRRWTAGLALRGNLPARLRVNAEAGYTRASYLGTESWADEGRRDKRLSYNLSLSRDLAGGYYVTLAWQRWRTLSNLALYSSERSQVQVQVSKAF